MHRLDADGLVEYGLLIATIAMLTLIGANAFGGAVLGWFNTLIVNLPR